MVQIDLAVTVLLVLKRLRIKLVPNDEIFWEISLLCMANRSTK